jgi:hypothetical protein
MKPQIDEGIGCLLASPVFDCLEKNDSSHSIIWDLTVLLLYIANLRLFLSSTMENVMKSWDETRFRDTGDRKLKVLTLLSVFVELKSLQKSSGDFHVKT